MDDLSRINHIHFIGIGGSSMSGLAEISLNSGYKVSGSDMKKSEKTDKLSKLGADINIYHSENNLKNPDLVVYTVAVKGSNPELAAARKRRIPVMDRAGFLGLMMKQYKYSIAVAGTHGKTTTTSMISLIMINAGLNPTVHIGAEVDAIGGSIKSGGKEYFVTEACEYYESFLKFNPYTAVILNIEADHLDYFRDLNHIKDTFYKFTQLVPEDGFCITCIDDNNTRELTDKVSCTSITYGTKKTNADWIAEDIHYDTMGLPEFTVRYKGIKIGIIKLGVPGYHNVQNALAAISTCYCMEIGFNYIKKGLAEYCGSRHRFEIKGVVDNIKVIDDYAHHPSEIRATLGAAANCDYRGKIWCIFQPHTYTRTKLLMSNFIDAFDKADFLIVSDIYAARETNQTGVHSNTLAEKINNKKGNAVYMPDFDQIADYLLQNTKSGDLIITMGAGDIYKVADKFLQIKKTSIEKSS